MGPAVARISIVVSTSPRSCFLFETYEREESGRIPPPLHRPLRAPRNPCPSTPDPLPLYMYIEKFQTLSLFLSDDPLSARINLKSKRNDLSGINQSFVNSEPVISSSTFSSILPSTIFPNSSSMSFNFSMSPNSSS